MYVRTILFFYHSGWTSEGREKNETGRITMRRKGHENHGLRLVAFQVQNVKNLQTRVGLMSFQQPILHLESWLYSGKNRCIKSAFLDLPTAPNNRQPVNPSKYPTVSTGSGIRRECFQSSGGLSLFQKQPSHPRASSRITHPRLNTPVTVTRRLIAPVVAFPPLPPLSLPLAPPPLSPRIARRYLFHLLVVASELVFFFFAARRVVDGHQLGRPWRLRF